MNSVKLIIKGTRHDQQSGSHKSTHCAIAQDAQNAVQALLMLDELNARRAERHERPQSLANAPSSSDDEKELSLVVWQFSLVD